jgi:hypothetical protein
MLERIGHKSKPCPGRLCLERFASTFLGLWKADWWARENRREWVGSNQQRCCESVYRIPKKGIHSAKPSWFLRLVIMYQRETDYVPSNSRRMSRNGGNLILKEGIHSAKPRWSVRAVIHVSTIDKKIQLPRMLPKCLESKGTNNHKAHGHDTVL